MRDKVLIVTGSNGIAAAAVRMAVESGARLLVAASNGESAWELAAQTGAECWIGDLTQAGSADSIVSQCLSKFGRIDALFNAAGLSGRRYGDGPAHECSDEGWEITLAHNLAATFRMCRAVLGRMLQQEVDADGIRGSMVNMGSVLADAPEPRHFATHAYAAAKGAVTAMSKSMAAYYAPHKIRVNVVAPGLVRTAVSGWTDASPELAQFVAKKQPLTDGMVDAEEVARAAVFLLGRGASAITGEVMRVDGGWSVSGV
jgi:NAD(P)-dependent dehydrogenase (short-subunit alcohol dehydrogenase family)